MNDNTNMNEFYQSTPEEPIGDTNDTSLPAEPDTPEEEKVNEPVDDNNFTYGVFENTDFEEDDSEDEYTPPAFVGYEYDDDDNTEHHTLDVTPYPQGNDDLSAPRTLDVTPYPVNQEPEQNFSSPYQSYDNATAKPIQQAQQPVFTPQQPAPHSPYQAYRQPYQAAPQPPQPPQPPRPPQQPPYQPYYQAPPAAAGYGQPVQPPQPPYQPVYGAVPPQPQPQPKKRSTGAKVMLICLWVLLGLFGISSIAICGYYIGEKGFEVPAFDYEQFFGEDFTIPTTPDSDSDSGLLIPDEDEDNNDNDYDNSELYNSQSSIELKDYPSDKYDSDKYNTRTAFEKVSPSTVGIMCYTDKSKTTLQGEGTGIIIDTNGYIATNSHVIGDSKNAYAIEVVLNDGNTYSATVVGYDTRTDLAVIKIKAKNLVPAEFADSEQSSIGEDVIAVGNPGGMEFQNTLTRGVISAKDRTLDLSTQVSYIQTDAAINPGNSGGPLCNIHGQVIGINSAKIADADYEGMGFAIPSVTVKEVVDDLIRQGYVEGRVKIGITGTAIASATAEYNNVPQGILIAEIIEGGPCDNGEIKVDDIICKLDDYEIKSFNDIYTALTNYKAGDKATLTVYRIDTGKYVESEIILQADNGSTTAE